MKLRWLVPVLGSVVLVGVLFVGVFPTRTYLAQRDATAIAHERMVMLSAQNEALEERARLLQTDAEIERLAREQYNLVMPGEEAYALLPPPAPPTTLAPEADPEDADPRSDPASTAGSEPDRNLVQRLWAFVTGG